MGAGKYIHIWSKELESIICAIKEGGKSWNLSPSDFTSVGNRVKSQYDFRLEYKNGISNRGSSAVGRDLQEVLSLSSKFRELVGDKDIVIRMSRNFVIQVFFIDEVREDKTKSIDIDNNISNEEELDSEAYSNVVGFPLIENVESEILILGTAPSEESLSSGEYYANKKNVFWNLMSKFFNEEKPFLDYQQKVNCLLEHHVAIWDSLKTCKRKGSSDDKIKDPVSNDLQSFIKQHPRLKIIIFNGLEAYNQGMPLVRQYMKDPRNLKVFSLISTSGQMNRRAEERERQWRNALGEL